MTASFREDLEYLGKVILLTFMLLGFIVILKNHIPEGIILLTLAGQLIIIWYLVGNYKPAESITGRKSALVSNRENYKKYLYIISLSILFIIAFWYIFRAISFIQHSVLSYGEIRADLISDIIFAFAIGIIMLILFIILFFTGKKYFPNFGSSLMV